jgi:hypothetical protein
VAGGLIAADDLRCDPHYPDHCIPPAPPDLDCPDIHYTNFRVVGGDSDGDRCDTREEVLITESRTPAQVDPYGCKVVAGDWFSIYDGVVTDQPGDLDIDHVVALAEAWDSGAASWDTNRRRAFANDLDEPAALIAVTASSNRSKRDEDPAEWRPPRREASCQAATRWP